MNEEEKNYFSYHLPLISYQGKWLVTCFWTGIEKDLSQLTQNLSIFNLKNYY